MGPKWALNRYRLHEAVDRLKEGAHSSFTELAMELGGHCIRDRNGQNA